MRALIINLNLAVDKTVRFPVFKPGNIYRLSESITQPGGKGVNVARALKELGAQPVIVGFVSGHNGRWIEERLAAGNFPAILARHDGGESRFCYSVLDNRGISTDLNEEGPLVPVAAQAAILKKVAARAKEFQVAAVCGRVSRGIKKGFYARLTKILKEAGCFTAYDTSGTQLMEAVAAGADLVKINKDEFKEISGLGFSRRDLRSFFKKYSPCGLKALIITDGPRPTLAVSQFGMWEAVPVRLKRIESPVGAGDSFMAGFIYGFMKGLVFEANLKLATACSASDCGTLGAGAISRREAEALAARVKVREL